LHLKYNIISVITFVKQKLKIVQGSLHNTDYAAQSSWGREISFKFAQLSFSIQGSQGFREFGFHLVSLLIFFHKK